MNILVSSNHSNSIRIFLQRPTKKDRIDAKSLEVFESEFKYVMRCAIWYHLYNFKNVKITHGGVLILVKLQALAVNVAKFLATCGLAFRGIEEKIGSQIKENFLGIIELISQHDPFLAEHLVKYGNLRSEKTSYLSKTIYKEGKIGF